MRVLLSSAYWPNLQYFYYLLNHDFIIIEQFDNYQKQSYRNRTQILAANGPLSLFLPITKNLPKVLVKDIQISHVENWEHKHWGAIKSAYGKAPYFEFFADEIAALYETKHDSLLEFNLAQIACVFRILRIKKKIELSSAFVASPQEVIDMRETIHPKSEIAFDTPVGKILSQPYYQTFGEKFSFVPNLSILDLLFNKGLAAIDYLKQNEN